MGDKPTEFFKIILAGKRIEVECNYRVVLAQCRDYLAEFDRPDFVVRASIEDIIAGRKKVPDNQTHIPGIAFRYADEYLEPYVVYKEIAERLIDYDTFLMHGAVVATDSQAYMFVAPSGVGKTTRAVLWLKEFPGSIIVNGDKPLVKVTGSEVLACGTPWCGSEGYNTNIMLPLRAIILLERAEEEKKSFIQEISIGNAFPTLLQQTYRPNDVSLTRKTINLLKALEGKVRFYKFRSTPTPDSIHLAFDTVSQNQ